MDTIGSGEYFEGDLDGGPKLVGPKGEIVRFPPASKQDEDLVTPCIEPRTPITVSLRSKAHEEVERYKDFTTVSTRKDVTDAVSKAVGAGGGNKCVELLEVIAHGNPYGFYLREEDKFDKNSNRVNKDDDNAWVDESRTEELFKGMASSFYPAPLHDTATLKT